jgi:CRP/FNR family transcriptional regulator, cyclic AMP receptor protein
MQSDIDTLRRTEFFAGLPDEHLATLAGRAQHRAYESAATIFREGDPGDSLFIVESGEIKLTVLSPTRQEIILASLGPGDMFGELALFDRVPRTATATAMDPSTCLVLRRDDFLAVVETEPSAIRAILRSLAGIIGKMNIRLADVAMLDVHGRMSKALFDLVDRHGRRLESGGIAIDRPVSSDELAGMTGLYPVEVEHLMRDYQYEDLIRLADGRIVIPHPEKLRRSVR